MSEHRLQEIISKSVVGRAERRITWSHTVPAEGVTGVLGVHVADSTIGVKEKDGRVMVDMLVDFDLWCGNQKNTKVLRSTSRCTEVVDVRTVGQVLGEREYSGRMIGAARAAGVGVADGQITLHLECDIAVEMTALARLWVKAFDLEAEVLEDVEDAESYESGSDSGSGE